MLRRTRTTAHGPRLTPPTPRPERRGYPPGYVTVYPPGYVTVYPPGYVTVYPPPPGYVTVYPPGYVTVYPGGYVTVYPPGYVPRTTDHGPRVTHRGRR
jgi:uncharacterized RDD family membrane protein YckC